MRLRSLIRFSGLLALVAGALTIGLALFLPRLLDVNAYRDEILAGLQRSLNRTVTFKSGSFAWHFGPSFDFLEVSVKEQDGAADFLTAGRISFRLGLLPLLEKRAVLKDVRLDRADVRLIRNSDGTFNVDDLLKPSKDSLMFQITSLRFSRSTLRWHDMAVRPEGFAAAAHDLTLEIDQVGRGKKGSVSLSCTLPDASGRQPGKLSLSGTVRLPQAGRPLSETDVNGSIDATALDSGRYWPYYGRFLPFDNPGGRLSLTTSVKGRYRDGSAKGSVTLNNASVIWPEVFHYTVAPRQFQIAYDLRLTPTVLDLPALEITADNFRIKGGVKLRDYAGDDPQITARAHTPGTFRYEDVRSFVPYGIIPPETSDYIENKIKAGVFRLDTGILDGRASQIAHMERGDNYKTLEIRGPVEKAVLSYGPRAPVFSNIKGTIELKDRNFNLIGMTAQFGESPLKMHGTITEYNTDKPSDYPVHMEISPRPSEVAWLARIAGADRLDYSGTTSLVLDGSGHYSAYRLNGSWDLKQGAYSFPDAVRKPSGMASQLTFSSVISSEQTRLTSLTCALQSLKLSATALLKYRDRPYLEFELLTNQFSLSESLPVLTGWEQFRPRGKMQAQIAGKGNPADFSTMDYSGSVALAGFSFRPGSRLKTVAGITGSVSFRGNSLETSGLSALYGESPFTVKTAARNLKTGETDVTFSSSALYLKDLDVPSPSPGAAIRRLNGSVSIQEGRYRVRNLSGILNSSNFTLNGVYASGASPEAQFTLNSSQLDIDDLVLLSRLKGEGGGGGEVRLKLTADEGKYGRIPFSRLAVNTHGESGVWYLQSLDAGVFGGRLAAKGRVASSGGQGDRYDLSFNLERVEAERLLQALDVTREVTGRLTVQGDVTARGDTLDEIRKSALGNVKLRLEKGSLRRFNVLSKVFSILNVSQLLKFQLPDMVADGMPFNSIKGSFSVRDGTLTTQDLFIVSDAMNISVIGSANVVREDLNFTVGVQPLQTVDKVINRIPVVGWLLTGKDRDFVTVYFEAKGTWKDPRVTAVPAKSLGSGVLNVFRRVFELPVRLFTDTGEVILGN